MPTLEQPLVCHTLGSTRLRYERCPRTGIVEFSCLPESMVGKVVPPREFDEGPHVTHLPARWQPRHAHVPEWLVQFKTTASPHIGGFHLGRSMRGGSDLTDLRFVSQHSETQTDGTLRIITELAATTGVRFFHRVSGRPDEPFFRVEVEARNDGNAPVTIDYLPSFSLGGITPFHTGEAAGSLRLHRFRSAWSAEGRHEARLLEELCLEASWAGFGRRSERFGQCGSLPVRGFFPWAAIEDTAAGVLWGVQLPAPGSWHLEVSRLKDRVMLSGGLPSGDFGDWWITLAPGESFTTPSATLATVAGDLDDLCHALVSAQVDAAEQQPEFERALPVIFNEWCSSWGEPTHADVIATAETLARHQLADIFVIDDGWAEKPAGTDIQHNGDWNVDRVKFPDGIDGTARELRAVGLTPGLWFEYEAATKGTDAYQITDMHLTENGDVIQVGNRHFWDLRNPQAVAYLTEKVIARLRGDGFGYLKIDYNETLPQGIDGPCESPGENLRQHLLAVQEFVKRIRREVPDILIENCSSGGHRLEPSFQALCAMGSFSDAHETWGIPIIAANLHRLILPRQSQVWCVVHPEDSMQRLGYGLAATFLGRMCISGGISGLSKEQLALLTAAREFHRQATPVIRDGRSRIIRDMGPSWNEPTGWQAVVRHSADQMLVVAHAFGNAEPVSVTIPLPRGTWHTQSIFNPQHDFPQEVKHELKLGLTPFSACAWLASR